MADTVLADFPFTIGEVHTGLLHHSAAVSPAVAAQLLDVVIGERVWRTDRPIPQVASPTALTGVDCLLPSANGAKVRAAGTVAARAVLTGGHVLQGSASTTVFRGPAERRPPWSYFLARPGMTETLTKVNANDVVTGFIRSRTGPGVLDLDAIGRRTMDAIQDRPGLDYRRAVLSSRTRLRWVAAPPVADTGSDRLPAIAFTIASDTVRTLRLVAALPAAAAVVEFGEDLARHDWLLTTVLTVIERSRIAAGPRSEVVERLQPAVDHLLHQWLPAARTDAALAQVWQLLEQRPGLTRQWQVNVDRIRDQVALGRLERLGAGAEENVGAHDA